MNAYVFRQWIEFLLIYKNVLSKTEINKLKDREVMRYWHQLCIITEAENKKAKSKK